MLYQVLALNHRHLNMVYSMIQLQNVKFFEPQSQRKRKRGRPRLLALAVASAATSTLANAQSIDLLGGHGTFTTQAEMEEHWRPQLETTS